MRDRLCVACSIAALCTPLQAKEVLASDAEFDEILSLDISQLTVTSVSKRPQKLGGAAAAVYVVTQEDLRRSGVTSIPDALRMVPGISVAQLAANRWAISVRGFSGPLASKLLVMIDGRTVYSPVFSGTYWDDQSTLLEDVDRIEVIRGPGASLYGANAVNGIINIITKNAQDTQGDYASAGLGTQEKLVEGRHGGKIGDDSYYRAYARYADYDSFRRLGGGNALDDWWQGRSGFRVDANQSEPDSYTLQGDVYGGRFGTEQGLFYSGPPFFSVVSDDQSSYGGNILGRWNRKISADSGLSLQASVDHYTRHELNIDQRVSTADIQFQHNIRFNERNNFIWGAGARHVFEDMATTYNTGIRVPEVSRSVLSMFAQDEYALLMDELYLTVGSKFEHNDYTGYELQPSARISWQASERQTFWGAVSRAVRTPSEIEDQAIATLGVLPGTPVLAVALAGNNRLKSEELTAYEIGWRIQPQHNLSFDATAFYNDYDNLSAFSPFSTPFVREGTLVFPVPFNNLGSGNTHGMELAANWSVTNSWRLAGSYSFLLTHLELDPAALTSAYSESTAPRHQASFRSYLDLSDTVRWDTMIYYTDQLAQPIPNHVRLDLRLAWEAMPGMELSLVGRNLLQPQRQEFLFAPQGEVERSVLARVSWRF